MEINLRHSISNVIGSNGRPIFIPPNRLLKTAHLRRFPHSSSLRRTVKYASLLRISGAPAKRDFAKLNLHLGIFEQPEKDYFFSNLFKINP
jgi:hypothetical protein